MELEGVKEVVPEQTLREGLEASIASLAEVPAQEKAPEKEVPAKEAIPAAVPGKEAVGKPAESAAKPASIIDTPPVTTEKVATNIRGPASWKPELREKFSALPQEVKAEVLRREHEISRALQESADSRKFAEQFQQIAAPYQHYIALEGNDSLKSFGNYLRTATVLRGGSPAEKANAVATAIATYGIDVQLLDAALSQTLSGRPMPHPQQVAPQQFRDPRLDDLLGQLQARQTQEEQAVAAELAAEVEAFAAKPENEFFEDLRMDIGDILKLAADRNQKMTLQEAHDKAAKLNPSISAILEQRNKAKTEEATKQQLLAKRNAASTVRSQAPRQTGNPNEPSASVRAAIENSISQLST